MENLRQKITNYERKIFGKILSTEVNKKGLISVLAAGIIGFGASGCGSSLKNILGVPYATNTIKNIERSPITEKQSPYSFDEFSMRGEVYDVLKPKNIEVDGEIYNVPHIVIRDDMREVIDDENRIVNIKPYNVYALVPVSFEKDKLKVVKHSVSDKRENIELDLKIPALPKRKGFSVSKRHSSETQYNLTRLGLGVTKQGNYIFENTQEVYGDNKSVIESLPIGWIPKKDSLRILDKKHNRIDLDGYLIKAVKGKFAKEPVTENKVPVGKATTPKK